jgi:L-ascorbate metabolism protein UlaG (beta-lactamase superfamily)
MAMKSLLSVIILLAGAVLCGPSLGSDGQTDSLRDVFTVSLAEDEAAFVYLGASAVILRTAQGAVIIDPAAFLLEEDMDLLRGRRVDAVLYTHDHGDHFDRDTAIMLSEVTGAAVGGEAQVVRELRKSGSLPAGKIIDFTPGRPRTVGAWTITPISGSHLVPILLYHLAAGGNRLFHAGDSAAVPLANLAAGLAFLPAGDPSFAHLVPADALKMALDLKPKAAVVFHGTDAGYEEFTKLCQDRIPGTKVIVPATLKVYTVKMR